MACYLILHDEFTVEADWVEWTIKDPNAAKQSVETNLLLTENEPLINGWF